MAGNENKILKDGEKKSKINILLNGIIVFLCIVALYLGYVAFDNMREAYSYVSDEESMSWRIEYGDFHLLVQKYYANVQAGYEASNTMREYYGVAKYYEAASMYKAFGEIGDEERANRELKKMQQAREEMGEWSIVEPDIKKQLGLEE